MQEVSAEELLRSENVTKGQMMAARFLKENSYDLAAALAGQDPALRPYLAQGARETFLLNINLPLDEEETLANRRAMSGLAALGQDRGALAESLGELEYLFDYYGKAMDSTYQRLKDNFSQRAARTPKKAEGRMAPGMVIDVERQPAFLEEWSRVRGQLGAQFEEKLSEVKQRIREIG
ncbi:MAG TPA: hypothetical protein VMW83_01025 [Spirochaetia bacterium]|nr:hypothetical protein [Spirochaetia bacterium]